MRAGLRAIALHHQTDYWTDVAANDPLVPQSGPLREQCGNLPRPKPRIGRRFFAGERHGCWSRLGTEAGHCWAAIYRQLLTVVSAARLQRPSASTLLVLHCGMSLERWCAQRAVAGCASACASQPDKDSGVMSRIAGRRAFRAGKAPRMERAMGASRVNSRSPDRPRHQGRIGDSRGNEHMIR